MEGHKTVVFGGKPLHERLASSLPELTACVLSRLVTLLPVYGRLPAEQLRGELSGIVREAIRVFIDVLRTGVLPERAELAAIREAAVRRAEEGLPIEAVIGAYHLGVQACIDLLEPTVEPGEIGEVFEAHRLLFGYLRLTTGEVSAGYLSERQWMSGDDHGARQTLLAALLEGGPAEEVARRAGMRLPSGYLALSLAVGRHDDEVAVGVDHAVAARRKLRRLRVELDRQSPEPVLSMLSVDGGVVLVPHQRPPAALTEADWAWLRGVVARLGDACGAPVVAGAAAASAHGVPDAVRLAGELREVAGIYDKPAGVYRLDDLLLEYQLTRPSPARDHLAALLRPAADKPDLLPTLRAFLDTGLNRRRTAGRLRVHPNTVDYRLRKIAALTGLQVSRHENLLAIRAALSALDAAAHP